MEGSMVVHVGLCVLPILYNFLIGHKLDITSFLCALPIGNINSRLRMMPSKIANMNIIHTPKQ